MTAQDPAFFPADHADDAMEPTGSIEMLAARQAALGLLEGVIVKKQTLDLLLETDAEFKALPQRDRAFCRMLVSTVLRRCGQIDDLIQKAEDRPMPKNFALQNILRLGVAQILFMNVPDHAAVDTSVQLAQLAQMDRQKGFVNALLRLIAREGRRWMEKQDEARLNAPDWLLRMWISDYGLGRAAQIARANLAEAPLDITVKHRAETNHWAALLQTQAIGPFSQRRAAGGPVTALPGFEDGAWWVQDAAAAIPARLFGDISGRHVIDFCAAPGGKTAQLLAMGASVTALDRSAQRLRVMDKNLERLGLKERVQMIAADAASWRPQAAPSYILLDAPCTATGTIRRHPDVMHLKSPRDLEQLVDVQARLLGNAFEILAPGGILIYCTCSLQKVEGEAQIQHLIATRRNAIKLPITPDEVKGLETIVTEDGDIRAFPFHYQDQGGLDGFFVSRLMKSR